MKKIGDFFFRKHIVRAAPPSSEMDFDAEDLLSMYIECTRKVPRELHRIDRGSWMQPRDLPKMPRRTALCLRDRKYSWQANDAVRDVDTCDSGDCHGVDGVDSHAKILRQ